LDREIVEELIYNTVHTFIHEQKKGGKLGNTFWGYAR
jgi:hypothetical protein